ncbi:hypothetical protein EDB89DRAFT_1904867 [Lactarius sanguifluus]|nr:hypothetical protein EDB89DRAFT_1904867 [Lactarius sanguifluus]
MIVIRPDKRRFSSTTLPDRRELETVFARTTYWVSSIFITHDTVTQLENTYCTCLLPVAPLYMQSSVTNLNTRFQPMESWTRFSMGNTSALCMCRSLILQSRDAQGVYHLYTFLYALAPAGASLDHEAVLSAVPSVATSPMSQTTSAGSSSRFQDIFNAALKSYQKQTNRDLIAHPLASQLQSCDSTSAILAVLQDQVREFDQARSDDERLSKWLIPTVNVLYAFSAAVSEGVGLVFSPAKVIFAGIGVFLLVAKDVAASKDALAELFERIGFFFNRLETYTEVTPTAAMTNIITKIMVEVLTIFGIATKELRRGSAKKFLKKLAGRTDLEDAVKKLDRLTQEEARMALAEVLRITHDVRDEVKVVDGKVAEVGDKVQCVDEKVQIAIDDGKQRRRSQVFVIS